MMTLTFSNRPLFPALTWSPTFLSRGAGKLVNNAALVVRTDESCHQPKIHTRSAQADLPGQSNWRGESLRDDGQGELLVPRGPLTLGWGNKD